MYYAFEHSESNWNLEVLVFEESGKPEYAGENLSEQRKNQQQSCYWTQILSQHKAFGRKCSGEKSSAHRHNALTVNRTLISIECITINNITSITDRHHRNCCFFLYIRTKNKSPLRPVRCRVYAFQCTSVRLRQCLEHFSQEWLLLYV
mgnify:CR=1 FL=1